MKKVVVLLLLVLFGIGNLSAQEEQAIGLGYDDLFFAYFNGTGKEPTDREIDGFIESAYPTEYRSSRNNEFEWRRLRQNSIATLTEGIANFDSDTLFAFMGQSQFGSYDFDREGFGITVSNSFGINASFNGRSETFTIVFTNNDDFNFMEMNPEEGNEFVKSRTGLLNYVDRAVRLRVYFKFADFSNSAFAALIRGRTGYYLHALIERIEVYYVGNVWNGDLHYVGVLTKR